MFFFNPSLDPADASANLMKLMAGDPDPGAFRADIQRLRQMFAAFVASCPSPWPAPGLLVTAEIHYMSELWLPLKVIRPIFERLYRTSLAFPPVFSSTPFAAGTSWAGIVAGMPACFDQGGNPGLMLERLLSDSALRHRFLFWSFMPERFYGDGSERYPGQALFLTDCAGRFPADKRLRCLDAACGDGAGTYRLARMLLASGRNPQRFAIEGWTIDPLEVWAAAHISFPHAPAHQSALRRNAQEVFEQGAAGSLLFRQADLLDTHGVASRFDIIICNGLLGGPIIHRQERIDTVVRNLAALLDPGGLLLTADRFHGGWKKNIPGEDLGDAFKRYGLKIMAAGEGLGGIRSG